MGFVAATPYDCASVTCPLAAAHEAEIRDHRNIPRGSSTGRLKPKARQTCSIMMSPAGAATGRQRLPISLSFVRNEEKELTRKRLWPLGRMCLSMQSAVGWQGMR